MNNYDVVFDALSLRNVLTLVESLIDISIDVGENYESIDADDYAVMYNKGFTAGMNAAKDIVMTLNQSFSPYNYRTVKRSENTEES